MRLAILPILLAAGSLPAHGQAQAQSPTKPAKATPAVQAPVSAPVIGCSSLANYRLLRQEAPDEAAAAARLADGKADHLGCAAFPRDRVTALADHVALGGTRYDCLTLQGTAICQWTMAGAVDLPVAPQPAPKPSSADKARR